MDLRLADKQPFVNGGERPSLDLAEVTPNSLWGLMHQEPAE